MILRSTIIATLILCFCSLANAQDLYCKQEPSNNGFRIQITLKIADKQKYLLAFVPVDKRGDGKFEFYSDVPIEIGHIEIFDSIDDSRLLITDGKLIITDNHTDLIAGLLIYEGRQYSIRLDRSNDLWSFVLHITNKKETISGTCH